MMPILQRHKILMLEGEVKMLTEANDRLSAAIRWALGEEPDAEGKWFGDHMPEPKKGKRLAPWWWRKPLRNLAGMGGLTYDKERRTIVHAAPVNG